jgi:hypothetical protein
LKHLKAADAEDLVARGSAERRSEFVIELKAQPAPGDASAPDENRPGRLVIRSSDGFTGVQLEH